MVIFSYLIKIVLVQKRQSFFDFRENEYIYLLNFKYLVYELQCCHCVDSNRVRKEAKKLTDVG